jgi:tyrosyl-tRNA synthetase
MAFRRQFLKAIDTVQQGGQPPMVLNAEAAAALQGPATVDSIAPANGWEAHWAQVDAERREGAMADEAEADFQRRAAGGVPDQIADVTLAGAPMPIGTLLKAAGLVPSTSEGLRMVEQGGVRIDGGVVSDKGLRVAAGTVVVQVGKRKFARVTLSA